MTEVVKNMKNISSYRFVALDAERLPALRETFLARSETLEMRGTVLLSTEGINMFLAGPESDIDSFLEMIDSYPEFKEMDRKISWSDEIPFTRMLVRIKREIISMRRPEIVPEAHTATHLEPKAFKRWLDAREDVLILDTRNDYETRVGSFKNAHELNIQHFTDFPKAIEGLPEEFKHKPVVTYCTGGIRCEKAAELMLQKGFKDVYQLDGGILRYFEECGKDHYDGECFVFDKRVAVDSDLNETETIQCYECRNPISVEEQKTYGGRCPYHENLAQAQQNPL